MLAGGDPVPTSLFLFRGSAATMLWGDGSRVGSVYSASGRRGVMETGPPITLENRPGQSATPLSIALCAAAIYLQQYTVEAD